MSKLVVTPGEFVCDVEEFLPGSGVFEEGNRVFSSIVGRPAFDREERKVDVEFPGKLPKRNVVGSLVYGRVIQVTDQFVIVELFPYVSKRFKLFPPSRYAAIHISKVRDGFVENLREEFGVGDWIRAKIISIQHRFFLQLSTVGENLGIIKAYCHFCRAPLLKKYESLFCPKCRRVFKRKTAGDYGNPKLPR